MFETFESFGFATGNCFIKREQFLVRKSNLHDTNQDILSPFRELSTNYKPKLKITITKRKGKETEKGEREREKGKRKRKGERFVNDLKFLFLRKFFEWGIAG